MESPEIERDGKEWERQVKSWLRLRYSGSFIEVPSEHGGDFGLEGFSRSDGIAFQCYAVREPLKAKDLYDNQQRKMREDLKKFSENKDDLIKLFGELKITAWWLVVPENKSAKLVQYATEKTEEIRKLNLPYVAANFTVRVATIEDFQVERKIAYSKALQQLTVSVAEPVMKEIDSWADDHEEYIKKLDAKIDAYAPGLKAEKHSELRIGWVKTHIEGQNVIRHLQTNHPDLYQLVTSCKIVREKLLFAEYSTTKAPADVLIQTLQTLREQMQSKAPGLASETIDLLACEAVADWLLRCPLDFPEERHVVAG